MAKPENADKGVAKSLLRLAVAHGADAVLAVVDAWKPNKVNADDIKLLELRLNQAREGLLKGGRDETMSGR